MTLKGEMFMKRIAVLLLVLVFGLVLALPAFAAPALRRRKKQGKKADTLR